MNLPDLALQIVYGRLAWGVIAAALAVAAWRQPSRAVVAGVTLASMLLMALPGAASPAYWLTLACQYPSGLLLGCALLALAARWRGETPARLLPAGVALPLVAVGALLYLDAFGVLALGLYYGGFGAAAAPLLACLASIGCAIAIVRGQGTRPALALLAGLLLYALPRLPTGNLWDALLDPLLWTWSVASAAAWAARALAAWRAAPAMPAAAEPVAAIEQLQTVRE